MSRLSQINVNEATGATADLFAAIKKAAGRVPNAYATIGTHSPAALGATLNGDAILAKSSLDKADVEAIKLAVSELVGCDYCAAAHTARRQDGRALAEGNATDPRRRSRPAMRSAMRSCASCGMSRVPAGTVDAARLNEVREAGYSEAQVIDTLFAMSVINFTNLVNRVNDTTIDFPFLV